MSFWFILREFCTLYDPRTETRSVLMVKTRAIEIHLQDYESLSRPLVT
jgi:hypothetical protein